MDERAYHLQPLAHSAVSSALVRGRLVKKPCELCGAAAQAHHDSYYPERWLDVRWLCGQHHREWHRNNQPEWPTIYEFHPSDYCDRSNPGRRGKRPIPWFRTTMKKWYVTINNKQINLGPDREEAFRKFEALYAEAVMQSELSRNSQL